MKADTDLRRDVTAELAWDASVKANAIGVSVKDGIVTLTGHIETFAEKGGTPRCRRQGDCAGSGCEAGAHSQASDTDIAAAATQALKWSSVVPTDSVRLTVENGWVTLQGAVEWDYQRRSAEKAVRSLLGVVGISNEITLRTQAKLGDLTKRIEEALTRQAIREAQGIQVSVEGHTVKLRGKVHSWAERDAVQGVAWSAPGVRSVVNELQLA